MRNVTDLDPIGLGRLGLVEQPIRRAAHGWSRWCAERKLGLQRVQAPSAHSGAQAPDAIALAAQFNTQPKHAIAAFMHPEYLDQRRFPTKLYLKYLMMNLLTRIVTASRYLH